jgi:translocation and assembly module TamB
MHQWEAFTWQIPGKGAISVEPGHLLSAGRLDEHRLELQTTITPLDYPVQHVTFSGRGDAEHLADLSLALSGDAGRLALAGTVRWLPRLAWDLAATGRDLDPGVASPTLPGRLDLDSRVSGGLDADGVLSLDAQDLDLSGVLRGETLRLQGNARLRDTELSIPGLTLSMDGGRLTLEGTGGWVPQPRWDLQLRADNLDPGLINPLLTGRLNLRASTEGRIDMETGAAASLELERLDGNLGDHPVSARGSARLSEGRRLNIPGLEARLGENRLELRGEATLDSADLHYRLDAPQLSALWPGLGGRLTGQGQLAGHWQQPDLDLALEGEGLAFETWSLERLALEARGGLEPQRPLALNLVINDLAQDGDTLVESLLLSGRGHAENHELNLSARTREGDLGLGLRGRFTEAPGWAGRVTRLNLSETRLGTWTLDGRPALEADAERARLAPLCLTQEASRLCLEGDRTPESGIQARLDLDDLSMAWLTGVLPENLALEGLLSANARLSLAQALSLELQADAPQTLMHVLLLDGERETIPLRDLNLAASLNDGRLEARSTLAFLESGQASAQLVAIPERDTHRLDGQARADLTELRWLEILVPQIRDPRGRLQADLAVSGTLATPEFRGRASLTGGQMLIPDAGLDLTDLSLEAAAEGIDRLTLSGRARSGPGELTLRGELGLAETGEPWANLDLAGERFQALRLPEAQVLISPELSLALAGREIRLSGALTVPEANIELRELPPQAVSVSRDEVIVDADAPAEPPLEIHSRVSVILGDQVSLSGFGLSARLQGQLDVEDSPGRATRVEGEIRIEDGRYKAYGQDLIVERGVLVFQGPADNPGLDIRAVRRIPAHDVTAGLAIGGTLQDPRSRVFSTPAMEDSEAMPFLLTGRPLSGASQSDANMPATAITIFGLEQGGMLTQQIGQAVGLDEFTVDAEGDLDQSALMMGKYLSTRLYVRYSMGLFERASSLLLRYTLSRSLSLETQTSGEAQSIDLIYRRER